MQLHADDGRARDPAGRPFACGSGCARPREGPLSQLVHRGSAKGLWLGVREV